MKTERMRVVLDTSVILASISLTSPYQAILTAFDDGKYDLYCDYEMLFEYEEKLQTIFGKDTSDDFLESILKSENAFFVESYYRLNLVTHDSDDNKFADCAFTCTAHYLVSNDKHLLQLNSLEFPVFNVLKAAEFLKVLEDINTD